MRIYILSRNEELYSTRRLVEEANLKGWEVRVIDYLKCTIEIMKNELVINYEGKILPTPDAIIPRVGASRTFYGAAMVRHFEMMDVFSTTGNLALTRSRDKLRSLQVLSKNGVDMPKTVLGISTPFFDKTCKLLSLSLLLVSARFPVVLNTSCISKCLTIAAP